MFNEACENLRMITLMINVWEMHISLWYADQHKLVDHCISYKQYRELGGFVSKPLAPGDWTFRIRAESLGGRGNWTPHMSFFIEGAGKQQLVNLFVTMRYDTIGPTIVCI